MEGSFRISPGPRDGYFYKSHYFRQNIPKRSPVDVTLAMVKGTSVIALSHVTRLRIITRQLGEVMPCQSDLEPNATPSPEFNLAYKHALGPVKECVRL